MKILSVSCKCNFNLSCLKPFAKRKFELKNANLERHSNSYPCDTKTALKLYQAKWKRATQVTCKFITYLRIPAYQFIFGKIY